MSQTAQTPASLQIGRDIAFRAGQAIDDGRPLFLIVYYEHEAVKISFLKILAKELRAADITPQTFDPVQRSDHGSGRLYPLLSAAATGRILALIAGLPFDPGPSEPATSFLVYLNLHRDQIIRDKLRFVLFLHTSDAERFMASAGDLWDFRHHTYWLEGAPARDGVFLWQSMEQSIGETALAEQDREEIGQHIQRILSLIEQTGDAGEKAGLFLDLSGWLRRRYALEPSVQAAMEGLRLLSDDSSKLRGNLEFALGYALRLDNNLSDALVHYQRSLAIRQEIGDKAGEGVTLNNISQIYDARGDYDNALEYLNRSLAIRQEIGDKAGEGVTLNNISLIFKARGDYDNALEYLNRSLAISQEIGDKAGEGVTLNNISQIYDARGDYDTALEYLNRSLAIRQEIGDKAGEGVTLNNISQIYDARGDYDNALEYLNRSLAISQEIGDKAGEGSTCWNLALEYERRGELDKASGFARRTVEIEEELRHPDAQQSQEFLLALERELSKKALCTLTKEIKDLK